MGGGSLVMWPVEHLWRGFAFGYSRTSHACYFSAIVIPLYIKTDRYLIGEIGNRLAGGKLFDFSPDAYEASAASLRKAVLEEGVPFLKGIRGISWLTWGELGKSYEEKERASAWLSCLSA